MKIFLLLASTILCGKISKSDLTAIFYSQKQIIEREYKMDSILFDPNCSVPKQLIEKLNFNDCKRFKIDQLLNFYTKFNTNLKESARDNIVKELAKNLKEDNQILEFFCTCDNFESLSKLSENSKEILNEFLTFHSSRFGLNLYNIYNAKIIETLYQVEELYNFYAISKNLNFIKFRIPKIPADLFCKFLIKNFENLDYI